MQGGPHEGGGLGAVGSADAPEPPEELRQREGRTPGSQRRAPLRQARAPGPKRSRSDRQRAHGPPAVSDPVRRPAPPRLGPYLSLSRAARLARHCAALPLPAPQWRWPAALRPAPTRPIERETRRSLASRAPSHRGGAPCRRRPPADAAAGAGEPPTEPRRLPGWEETESQGRAGPQIRVASTVLEPRILPPSGPPTVGSPLSSHRGLLKHNSDQATSLLKTASPLCLN